MIQLLSSVKLRRIITVYWKNKNKSHICVGVGVKIPQLGYLDPPPIFFVLKSSVNTIWYQKLLWSFILSWWLNWLLWFEQKIFLSHDWLGNRGWGQDTPARVSWPPPSYLFSKALLIRYDIDKPCDVTFYHDDKINPYGWTFFFTYSTWNQGRGSRYPSWGILTPTQ